MDMFMDKLAQKLNAQEIIRANSAADAEEMNKLKNQVEEYNDCLARLQKLIEEGTARLQSSQAESADVKRLAEESIGKIQAIQQDSTGFEELGKRLEQLEKITAELGNGLEQLKQDTAGLGVEFGELKKNIGELGSSSGKLEERIKELGSGFDTVEKGLGGLEEGFQRLEKGVQEQIGTADENVHKECVKVYRNVQAVVVEESEKQQKAVEEAGKAAGSLGGKINAVLGISVAALIFSLAGVILQLLSGLNIKLF